VGHQVMVALWLKAVAQWRCGGVAKARDVASGEVAWTVAKCGLVSRDLPE